MLRRRSNRRDWVEDGIWREIKLLQQCGSNLAKHAQISLANSDAIYVVIISKLWLFY